ncbi:MAG: LacI family DNA-binding transcriptional regulator, partial [Dermatophilaceae bacterium]
MTEKLAGRRRATIMDVAQAALVSRQTVSNVVNKPHRVAPDTLERVQREIDRLGFRTNLAARSLSHRRANAL